MQRSTDQKVIRIASFFNIAQAVLSACLSIFFFVGTSFVVSADPSEVADLVQETGLTTAELGNYTSMLGYMSGFTALLELVLGILGLRASNDASKIMPVWVLAIVSVLSNIVTIARLVMQGTPGSSLLQSILPLVISAVVLYSANNIKSQIGR